MVVGFSAFVEQFCCAFQLPPRPATRRGSLKIDLELRLPLVFSSFLHLHGAGKRAAYNKAEEHSSPAMRPHALLRRGHVAISHQKHQWRRVPDVPRASGRMAASPPTPAEAPEIDIAAKTVQTAVGPLPLSPIMDPSFHEARQRWRTPKPKPAAQGRQRWQRILARNPFGKAFFCAHDPSRLPAGDPPG